MSAARLLIEMLCSTFDPTISVYKLAINLYPRPDPLNGGMWCFQSYSGWNSHGLQSGYGIHGGESRCFTFWQAVAKVFRTSRSYFNPLIDCVAHNWQCYAESDRPGKCTLFKEDYNECLHHRKAVSSTIYTSMQLKLILYICAKPTRLI